MENLPGLVRGYLEAEGYAVSDRGRELLSDLLVGRREGMAGEQEYVYAWVLPDLANEDISTRERPYLRRFQEAREEHPGAAQYFIAPTRQGLSRDFTTEARRWHGVQFRVPVQFFDTDFKWDKDRNAASATSRLVARARHESRVATRVAQPYEIRQSPNPLDGGEDLHTVLHEELRRPVDQNDRPNVHVVVGPAGMGKSVLFESLYAGLHTDFMSDKDSQRLSVRPFALLPEHINDASAPTVRSLLDGFLSTEMTRPLRRDVFEWLLVNGMGMWLLDGLDEVLERDNQFFDEYLMELMTKPFGQTSPAVLICVRDSLFATHRGLRDFCEEYRDHVVVYELSKWQRSSKIEFARRKLRDQTDALSFVERLQKVPTLDELASTPYYCDLLADDYPFSGSERDYTEQSVLERALAGIVRREREEKNLLNIIGADDVDDRLREFVRSCAAESLSEGFRGIPVADVRENAEASLPTLSNEEEIERYVTQMSQMPVFSQGEFGRLRFAQEPLEHYLVSDYLIEVFARNPEDAFMAIGRCELPVNVVRLVSAAMISRGLHETIWPLLRGKFSEQSNSGSNALKIAVQLSSGTDWLAGDKLQAMNLSRLQFSNHNLRDVSFNGSDLTNTDFSGCDITGASFDGCLLKGTIFPLETALVHFGDMHRFFSAYIGEEYFEEAQLLQKSLQRISADEPDLPACEAALQLRYLFNKFVTANGEPIRKRIDRRGALRGKRFTPADPEYVLDESIRAGYLSVDPDPRRSYVARADTRYTEIREFAMSLKMMPGLRTLLDRICYVDECPHVR